MSETTVASRYAKSLIDLAQEQNNLEETRKDMGFFVDTLRANSQLLAVLRNPIVSHDKKVRILDGLFGGKVHHATSAFFRIMINKSRAQILYATGLEFINQYNTLKHIVKASVVSAAPLSEANQQQIANEIKQAVGGEVILQTKVDPDLIGGFILTIGDRQIDTSIATDLKKLKKDFAVKVVL